MTVEERTAILKLAIQDALAILADVLPVAEAYQEVIFGQVLNQMVYARIEEWGEQQSRERGA